MVFGPRPTPPTGPGGLGLILVRNAYAASSEEMTVTDCELWSLALFGGEFLLELLEYLGSDLYALHQPATGIHDGFAEIGDPQVFP